MCFGDGVYCMVLVLETFLLADVAQFLTSFQEFGAAMMVFTVLFAKLDPLYSSVGPSQVNKGLKQIPCMHTFSQADQQTNHTQTNKPQANNQANQAKPNIYIRNIFRYQIGNHFLVHRLHAQWGRGDERGPLAARQNPNAITKTARQRRM